MNVLGCQNEIGIDLLECPLWLAYRDDDLKRRRKRKSTYDTSIRVGVRQCFWI